jgi:transposase
LSITTPASARTIRASKYRFGRARVRPPSVRAAISRREKCSEALHILDRFHIVAKMNKALDEVRAEETRRMQRKGRDPVLKKSRWLLLKRTENLGDEQHFRLRDLLRYNLKTVRAYLLKEAFQQLWDYNSPAWAGKFRDEWFLQTMVSHRTHEEDRPFAPPAT